MFLGLQNILNFIVKKKVNIKNNFFLMFCEFGLITIFKGIVHSKIFSLIIISLMLAPCNTKLDIRKSIMATFSNLMKVNEIGCATELQNDKNTFKIILICTPYEVK